MTYERAHLHFDNTVISRSSSTPDYSRICDNHLMYPSNYGQNRCDAWWNRSFYVPDSPLWRVTYEPLCSVQYCKYSRFETSSTHSLLLFATKCIEITHVQFSWWLQKSKSIEIQWKSKPQASLTGNQWFQLSSHAPVRNGNRPSTVQSSVKKF
jgi:hypothetical protein